MKMSFFEKFKKWFTYDPPYAATFDGWDQFEQKFKKNAIIRYYLNESISYIRSKSRRLKDIKYWFLYRFHPCHRYHVVDSGLGYGYHDKRETMLHAMFNLLVDYVEVELASRNDSYKEPITHMIFHPFTDHRSPKDGIEYLMWEINSTGPINIGVNSSKNSQSGSALEVYTLYMWWKNRKQLYDLTEPKYPDELNSITETNSIMYTNSALFKTQYPDLHKAYEEYLYTSGIHEENTDAMDQVMLHRLINIRLGLWT